MAPQKNGGLIFSVKPVTTDSKSNDFFAFSRVQSVSSHKANVENGLADGIFVAKEMIYDRKLFTSTV